MTPEVHILATVRNPALMEAALLVFKTLRVGFPTAHVYVQGNGLELFARQELERASRRVGASFANDVRTSHDAWIESLVMRKNEPFWICDTDVVFFSKVEHWFSDQAVIAAGRLEPEFLEEWTKTIHVERLHTALMHFSPKMTRQAMRTWMGQQPGSFFAGAQMNMIRQSFVPVRGSKPLFYDTCAGLFQAFGGTAFTENQNHEFEHLHCATYSDLVCAQAPGLKDLAEVHRKIFDEPALARGMQREQAKYYASRKLRAAGELVVPEKGEHAIQSRSNT